MNDSSKSPASRLTWCGCSIGRRLYSAPYRLHSLVRLPMTDKLKQQTNQHQPRLNEPEAILAGWAPIRCLGGGDGYVARVVRVGISS